MPYARDRLYKHPDLGGLGLIKLDHLLISLRCCWLERILKGGVNDTWREVLYSKGGHLFQNIREDTYLEFNNPLIRNIVCSYWTVAKAWWSKNYNYKMVPLILNPLFTRGRNPEGGFDIRQLDGAVVGLNNYTANEEKWLKCKYNDFVQDDAILPFATAKERTGINFSVNVYFNMVRAVTVVMQKINIITGQLLTIIVGHRYF